MAKRAAKKTTTQSPTNGHDNSQQPVSHLRYAMLDWSENNLKEKPIADLPLSEQLPIMMSMSSDGEGILWAEIKSDDERKDTVDDVRALRKELEDFVHFWGRSRLIEDLSLQQVMTLKRADVKSSWFYNPVGGKDRSGKWVKIEYVNKKPVNPPAWWTTLVKTKKAKDWQYDPKTGKKGSEITDQMLAKFTARGAGAKLSEAEEADLGNLFE